jgi:hypothetical protein
MEAWRDPEAGGMVQRFGFELDGIKATLPLGFLEFLQLEAGADGLGRGDLEEPYILGKLSREAVGGKDSGWDKADDDA